MTPHAHNSTRRHSWRGITLPALFAAFGIAGALITALVLLNGAKAQQTTGRGISISPLTFEFRVEPGTTATDIIRIFNGGTEPFTASVQVEDIAPSGERGEAIIEAAETTSYSIATWMQLSENNITVNPGEQRVINFTMNIPPEAEPGGHYGSVTVEAQPDPLSGGSGVQFRQKVAALMLVDVAGDVAEELSLTDFYISTEQTTIHYDWIPTNWILEPDEITFVTRFENKGSVHNKPAGFITVTDGFGRELAKLPIDQRNILPDSRRVIETKWTPGRLTLGKIRAQVDVIYGQRNTPLFAAAEFWIAPVKVLGPWLIGGTIGLILIILLRKRLALALRVIFRGDATLSSSKGAATGAVAPKVRKSEKKPIGEDQRSDQRSDQRESAATEGSNPPPPPSSPTPPSSPPTVT